MKPLIDLSKAAGKIVEKIVDWDEYRAIHFQDGSAAVMYATCIDGDFILSDASRSELPVSRRAISLGLCSAEEIEAFERSDAGRRESREKEYRRQRYEELKKEFEPQQEDR